MVAKKNFNNDTKISGFDKTSGPDTGETPAWVKEGNPAEERKKQRQKERQKYIREHKMRGVYIKVELNDVLSEIKDNGPKGIVSEIINEALLKHFQDKGEAYKAKNWIHSLSNIEKAAADAAGAENNAINNNNNNNNVNINDNSGAAGK